MLLHVDEPGLLPQLPGGTLEPGEPVGPAGLREAVEETGLERLLAVGYLGTRRIEPARSLCAQTLDTRFVHLECRHRTPVRWPSLEATPHGGGPPVPYECVWVPLAAPGPMDARDALALPLVRASLARRRAGGRAKGSTIGGRHPPRPASSGVLQWQKARLLLGKAPVRSRPPDPSSRDVPRPALPGRRPPRDG